MTAPRIWDAADIGQRVRILEQPVGVGPDDFIGATGTVRVVHEPGSNGIQGIVVRMDEAFASRWRTRSWCHAGVTIRADHVELIETLSPHARSLATLFGIE